MKNEQQVHMYQYLLILKLSYQQAIQRYVFSILNKVKVMNIK